MKNQRFSSLCQSAFSIENFNYINLKTTLKSNLMASFISKYLGGYTSTINHYLPIAICFILIQANSNLAKAQLTRNVSLNIDYVNPMGNFNTINNQGFGAGLCYNFGSKSKTVQFNLSVNYVYFSGRNLTVIDEGNLMTSMQQQQADISFLTSRLGVNFHFPEYENLYTGLEVGIGKYLPGSMNHSIMRRGVVAFPDDAIVLTLSRKLGYLVPIGKHHLDISLRYEVTAILQTFKMGIFEGTQLHEDLAVASFIGCSVAYRFSH